MSDATPAFTGSTAAMVRRAVTVVVFVIAVCAFAFGFGNGWQLGVSLGVPGWIAPLVAPAVDLSVVALLAAIQLLRSHGGGGRLFGPRLLLACCGFMTFALNTARPIVAGQFGQANFDAIAPLLLIGWSEVGPRILALLQTVVPDDESRKQDGPEPSAVSLQDGQPVLPSALIEKAHYLDITHQQRTGRRISRDQLRARLRVSNAVAGQLLRAIRSPPLVGRLSTALHLE